MDTAIQCIYRDLDYAKSLIKPRTGKTIEGTDGHPAVGIEEDEEEENEESWTFVGGDEPDPEFLTRKLSETFAGLGAGAPLAGPGSVAPAARVPTALGNVALKTGTTTGGAGTSLGVVRGD